MSKSGQRVRHSRDEIRKLVREYKRSGLSREGFADSIGVHANTVGKWVRQESLKKTDREQLVVPVEVKAEPGREEVPPIELVLRNGRVIRVGRDFDPRTLSHLIETLEAGC